MTTITQPKSVVVTARVQPSTKEQADNIFKELGMNTSQAISMFLTETVRNKKLSLSLNLNSDNLNSDLNQVSTSKLDLATKITGTEKEITNPKIIKALESLETHGSSPLDITKFTQLYHLYEHQRQNRAKKSSK